MNRLKVFLPNRILRMIYCSLILPHMFYGILVWGYDLKKLETLQKKAVRIIDKAHFLEHTEKLFKKYKLLKITDLFKSKCLNFAYKLLNKTLSIKILETIHNI